MATHQMYALVQEADGTNTELVFGNFTGRQIGDPCCRLKGTDPGTTWIIKKIFSAEDQDLLDELVSKYGFSRTAALFNHQ